ncbi:MAG: obg 2 [Firmicutes bacterium]|nr:obg 2 [Bacillota bacterium]
MKEFAVVGRPNSGKTMFTLSFAGYLNCRKIDVTFRSYDGLLNCRHFSLSEAKKDLCDPEKHKTRMLQSTILKIPVGKSAISFKLTDTCGVTENINSNATIRQGMAQTLHLLNTCDFIIHIIDVATLSNDFGGADGIDQEITEYGLARNRYLLLANKMDLPAAKDNLRKIITAVDRTRVIPVSSLHAHGFGEVKAYVARNL